MKNEEKKLKETEGSIPESKLESANIKELTRLCLWQTGQNRSWNQFSNNNAVVCMSRMTHFPVSRDGLDELFDADASKDLKNPESPCQCPRGQLQYYLNM